MVCHAIKEASAGQRIKVLSDDTDVLVIMGHHYFNNTMGLADIDSVTMESTDSSASQINVKEVARVHSAIMPHILAAHALTGYDTVSSSSRIEKLTVLRKRVGLKEN